jgi:hypothetical protein
MANTFELIQAYTVGSGGQSSIDFTTIPSTYTDLCVKINNRAAAAGSEDFYLRVNGSSTSYSYRYLYGTGSVAGSANLTTGIYFVGCSTSQTASTFGNTEIYIPNYAGSTNKSFSVDSVDENNATAATMVLGAGLWSNSAAITSISIYSAVGNTAQYSTAYLYGVKNA